jgi:hypothetical protein
MTIEDRRPDGVTDATVEAVGALTEALETTERARGHLYEFHQLTGSADAKLGHAVELLRAAGHREVADRLAYELIGRNILPGRWTYQIVEEYDPFSSWRAGWGRRIGGRHGSAPQRSGATHSDPAQRQAVPDRRRAAPAATYLTTNDMLIPIGRAGVAGTEYDFRTPKLVGQTKLNVCYTDLQRVNGVATATVETHGGHQIQIWVDDTHKFLQVYTDDSAPDRPARAGISVEPMTSAPNAFNSGDGLIVLDPGHTYRGSWGLRG